MKHKFEIVHKEETILKACGVLNINDFTLLVNDEIIDLKKELMFLDDKEVSLSFKISDE